MGYYQKYTCPYCQETQVGDPRKHKCEEKDMFQMKNQIDSPQAMSVFYNEISKFLSKF